MFRRIKAARIAAMMTAEELSKESGVPLQTITDLEEGKMTTVSSKTLLAIADAMRTDLDDIFF